MKISNTSKTKSSNQVIEEIHESFYTEVDKLLASAKISNSLETNKQGLIDKRDRLRSLGFANTKEIKEAEEEISRLNTLKAENKRKQDLVEAINYFSFKYPHYKFITEESVKKICEKYGLVYGTVDRYIGTVPDENLKHIEEFKISDEDTCYRKVERGFMSRDHVIYISKQQAEDEEKEMKNKSGYRVSFMYSYTRYQSPLEIAAPLKDFNMKDYEVVDYEVSKTEILDPIVLKPVIFKNVKHYLIVTAWGEEANDEMVQNETNN